MSISAADQINEPTKSSRTSYVSPAGHRQSPYSPNSGVLPKQQAKFVDPIKNIGKSVNALASQKNRTASINMFQANSSLHTRDNSKTTFKVSLDTGANWNKSQAINGAGIIAEESQPFINQMNF